MSDFISEDDLSTFEGWLRYQSIDAATTTPDELADWRDMFDEGRELVHLGFAAVTTERVVGNGQTFEVVRLKISDAGDQALATAAFAKAGGASRYADASPQA